MDSEYSFPAWFSSLLLLCTLALAVFFFLMSIDESTSIHELIIRPLRNTFELGGVFYIGCLMSIFFVVPAFAIAYIPFLLRLPRKMVLLFFLAGSLYVGGTIGMELVGGNFADRYGFDHPTYILPATIEEILEDIGLIIFLATLFWFITSLARNLIVKLPNNKGITI